MRKMKFVHFLSISLIIGSCNAQEDECKAPMDSMGSKISIKMDAKTFTDMICATGIPSTNCYLQTLGVAYGFAELKQLESKKGFRNSCNATNPACEAKVNSILTTFNDTAFDPGNCACRFLHALCGAQFPKGICDEDIFRLIEDYSVHKVPQTRSRKKRDFWNERCRFGVKVWPANDDATYQDWKKGYRHLNDWMKPELDAQGFVDRDK